MTDSTVTITKSCEQVNQDVSIKTCWQMEADLPLKELVQAKISVPERTSSSSEQAVDKDLAIEQHYVFSPEEFLPPDFRSRAHSPTRPEQVEFHQLQKWEGVVLEVKEDYFVAQLTDIFCERADELAEICVTEVSPADRRLLEEGTVFYWSIGYENRHGTWSRKSIIRFRRLPVWTEKEIERAKKEAIDIGNALGWT